MYLILEIVVKGKKTRVKLDLSQITVKEFITLVSQYDSYDIIEYRNKEA